MSDPISGPLEPTGQPEHPDTFRKISDDAIRHLQRIDHAAVAATFVARYNALLAAEDEQPATPATKLERNRQEYLRRVAEVHSHAIVVPAAPVDEHPPTFHVRPVWVTMNGNVCKGKHPDPHYPEASCTKQWRWGAREANGEIVIPESQALEHKSHALSMAHRFADPLGAKVVVDDDA